MNEPTHIDLFSGIGGFALAAGWAGFRTIAFSEVEPYPCAVLEKHWPGVRNLGDIREWRDWPDLGDVSLLTGGFPCQPFSVAGQRRGSGDDRHLWPAMRDVIGRCKPAWVLGENVPGIIGMELDQVLSDLEGLGYRVKPLVIPACAVDAQHRRDRIWILANAGCEGRKFGGIGMREAKMGEVFNDGFTDCCQTLANAIRPRLEEQREQPARQECSPPKRGGQAHGTIWPTEPDVGRVASRVSNRVDRIKGLGNAIVPQVAQVILKAIRINL